jgi:RNA polymerase sigma-70 factor (ECF subfamily)
MAINNSLFWQLLEKEHERARAYCGRLTGDFDEGDDLYQDSVIKAYNGFGKLKLAVSFRPWFYRIIANNYKGRFRTSWWKRVLSKSIDPVEIEGQTDPAELYEAKRRLNYAFQVLSVDDRILVTLAELDGWKISELAEMTSKTEGFIKMRLSRARHKMRKKLGKLYREKNRGTAKKGTNNICYVTRPEED